MSKSRKRKRQHYIHARVSEEEKSQLAERAKAYGGISAMFRVAALGAKPRPSQTDREAFAKALADSGRLMSELNKIGSNLNQLTHYANMGKTLEGKVSGAIDEFEALARELHDNRSVLMRALGLERRH